MKAQRLETSPLSPTTSKHQRIHFITSALIFKFHKESMCEYMYEHVREFQGFCWEHEIKIEVIFHVQYIKSVCRLPLKKLFEEKKWKDSFGQFKSRNVNLILYKQLHLSFNTFDSLSFSFLFVCFFFLCLSKNLGYSADLEMEVNLKTLIYSVLIA